MSVEVAEVIDFLAAHAPFDALTPQQRAALASALHIRYFRRGTEIMQRGNPNHSVYVLRAGAVDIVDAEGHLVERTEPGGSFGSSSLLARAVSRYDVTAIEDSLVYVIPGETFTHLYRTVANFRTFYSASHLQRSIDVRARTGSAHLRLGVSSLLQRPLVSAPPDVTIREAARLMTDHNVSSLVILDDAGKLAGIVTDRDLRRRVIVAGVDTSRPIADVMTTRPVIAEPHAQAFELLLHMTTRNVHHLPVVEDGKPVGVVSAGDLMRLETTNPIFLVGDISKQEDAEGLAEVASRIPDLVANLHSQKTPALDVARVVTSVVDALTARFVQLAEDRYGPAPGPWAWVVLGSQARREMTLNSDQDHAIVCADDVPPADREWFRQVAEHVTAGLAACGIGRCPGNVMATNPAWRMDLHGWKKQFGEWMNQPSSDALMHTTIFFDMRYVHGDRSLVEELRRHVLSVAPRSARFLGNLAAMAVDRTPPIGFFRQFVVAREGDHKDAIDLKTGGLHPVIELARIFCLAEGFSEVSTLERLEVIGRRGQLSADLAQELIRAFTVMSEIRLEKQLAQVAAGGTASNYVLPAELSPAEKRDLKAAFQIIRRGQGVLTGSYQTHLMN